MKKIIFLFLFLPLFSNAQTIKFSEVINNIDTNQSQNARGCQKNYVKLIDSTFVLNINYSFDLNYNFCQKQSIDSTTKNVNVYLEIFPNGKSNISNHCSCMHIVNLEPAIAKVKAFSGEITICKTDPTDYYGNTLPKITIVAKDLKFKYKGKEITIKKEVLWKLQDLGTPG